MLFSIIILSYNRPKQIMRILEHMLCSESSDFSLIIKDDCSPKHEEIRHIVDSYREKAKFEIVLHCNNTNLGYDKNLLDAFNVTNSDYVFLLSDDDYIDGAYLGELSNCLSESRKKIYFTPYNNKGILNRFNIKPYKLSRFHEVIYNSILFSGLIFDRLAVLSLHKDEQFLSNCIYTQVYLSSLIIYSEEDFGEAPNKLLYLGGDGENFFGKNQSAVNKAILQDRISITSNLNYQMLLLKVVDRISELTHPYILKTFKNQYNIRLIGYLLRGRVLGLVDFRKFVSFINKSKIDTDWRVKIFTFIIFFIPNYFSNAVYKLAVRLLKKSG